MDENFTAVSDENLQRARNDPDFRRSLVRAHLELLLDMLARVPNSDESGNPAYDRQIQDGLRLAWELARILKSDPKDRSASAA